MMPYYTKHTLLKLIMTFITILVVISLLIQLPNISSFVKQRHVPLGNNEITKENWEDSNFEIYIRLTSTAVFTHQIEIWPIKSMKVFFLKKYLELLIVLDDEKKADHAYGDRFPGLHPEFNVRVCYMKALSSDIYHNWGKARMYMDMMHADVCSTKEYVGFIDVDTLFVTAVTDNLLFEDKKPIVTGRIGIPRIPCWIQTAEYILGVKQVMQCMSYFPVTFKVSHIAEMRRYVEKLHNKTFINVFKEAPEAMRVDSSCYCHYSVMCNYMWYHHRDEYAWHLQVVPGGKWDGKGAIPSMVGPEYFNNEVKEIEKIPIPRTSVHTRHLMHKGKYIDGDVPPLERTDNLIREGLCYSFGFKICPKSCSDFNQSALHDSLFAFENYRWQWDERCMRTQKTHYENVNQIIKNDKFYINLNEPELCKIIDDLQVSTNRPTTAIKHAD